MSFWDVIWFIVIAYALFAYLVVLVSILTDLLRDHTLNGWLKAVWILALIFVPFLSALVYVVARGEGMVRRQARRLADVDGSMAA